MVNNYSLLIIILFGTCLRFYGLKWGLPYTFHADEHLFVIRQALRLEYNIFSNNSLNPEFSSYGTIPLYIFLFVKWIYFKSAYFFQGNIAQTTTFHFSGFADYLKAFYSYEETSEKIYMPELFIIGRAISACLGSISIYLTFVLGKKLYNFRVGILSALFFALTVGFIQASHFFTVDTVLIFFMLLTMMWAADIFQKRDFKYYIFAGVSLGLALSVKLTAIILFLPVIIAHLLRESGTTSRSNSRKICSKEFICLSVITVLLYLFLNPYSVLDFKNYWGLNESVTVLGNFFSFYQNKAYDWNDWRFSYNGNVPYWYDINNVLFFGMGIALELISGIGLIYSLKKREKSDKFLLVFVIPFFLIVGSWKVTTMRYILPLIPFVLILGARFLIDINSGARVKTVKYFSVLVIILVVLSTSFYSLSYANIYSVPDTRIQASDWIYENVKPNSVIVLENQYHYTVPLGSNRGLVGVEKSKKPIYNEKILWEYTDNRDQEYIKNHIKDRLLGADYIIVSEWYYKNYTNRLASKLAPAQYGLYKDLFSGTLGYRLIKTFDSSPNLLGKVFDEVQAELLFKVFDHPKIFIFKKS